MQTIRLVGKTEADGSLSLRIPLGKPEAEYEVVVVVQPKQASAAIHATLDVPARLNELRTLRDGWMDGTGLAPAAAGLDWLADVFRMHYGEELPLPYLYPTPEGGIQAEWSFATDEVSLEINLENHRGRWHTLNLESQSEETRQLDLDQATDWDWLAEQIVRSAGHAV